MFNIVKYRKITIGLTLFSSGCLISLIIIEVIVRLFFSEPIQPRFVIDSGYGVRDNQSNTRYVHYYPGEYKVVINTNNDGLRGKANYSHVSNENIYRIVILGDSHSFGYGCNDNEVFSHVLEKELNEKIKKYEVLNFSVPGFGTAEELVTYTEKVQKYNPDLVIVCYFNNDIGNDAVSNLFTFHNDSLIRTNNSFLPGVRAREKMYAIPLIRFLFQHSQAWNLIRNRLSSIVQKRLLSNKGLSDFEGNNNDQAKKLNKAILTKLVKTIHKDDTNVGIFIIPLRTLKSNFPFDPKENRNDVLFILDGRKIFNPTDYFVSDGHLNPLGHSKAAKTIRNIIINDIRK